MTTIDALHPIVGADRGEFVRFGGIGIQYKIPGDCTHGAYSVVSNPIEPGTLVPPHTHTREEEISFVLEGEIGVRLGDEVYRARAGEFVVKPRNVPHAFWNAGPTRARLLEIFSPPGFESYFRGLAELLAGGVEPNFERISAHGARYGISFHMELVPELCATYGVSLLGRG